MFDWTFNAKTARLKTLIFDDDLCKSCDLIYSKLTSIVMDVHVSTLEQFKTKKRTNGETCLCRC
jgi:hypothetical protein